MAPPPFQVEDPHAPVEGREILSRAGLAVRREQVTRGRIATTGGPELARRLEEEGYEAWQ